MKKLILLSISLILLPSPSYASKELLVAKNMAPPPPPPRTKEAAAKRDSELIEKQRLEIEKLRREVEALKAERLSQKSRPVKKAALAPTLSPTPRVAPAKVTQAVQQVKPLKKVSKIKSQVKPIKKSAKKRKPTSLAKNFKSGMHRFKKNCSMFSKPNSSSSKAGSVSAGKKLWIDSHNQEWGKAYKKSGTVFVHKSCF